MCALAPAIAFPANLRGGIRLTLWIILNRDNFIGKNVACCGPAVFAKVLFANLVHRFLSHSPHHATDRSCKSACVSGLLLDRYLAAIDDA